MSLISRAIPGLFGGVSQSIPAMRHPTQGALQENALSTVVSGLFKRPASKHIAQVPLSWASGASNAGNLHAHVVDQGSKGRWQLLLASGAITALNLDTGAQEPVVYQDANGNPAGVPSYLTAADPQTAFRTITVADTTFIVNSEKTVTSFNSDGSSWSSNIGWIYLRSAVPSQTYSITVNGTTASYTAPTTGATADVVGSGIVSALNAAGITASGSAVIGLFFVQPAGGISSLSVTDTYGNSTMTVLSPGNLVNVAAFSQLPPTFYGAYRLTIGGGIGANSDPYYVIWDGKQYVETRKVGVDTDINAATMPHKVFRQGGTWYVRPNVWAQRLVGDDTTNPMPSFVGRQIRDIFFYRNRLGFLAGDSLILSRSGEYYNFFAKTSRDVLDTDPVDLGGSAESVDTLDWAVPFNQQLIVWATRNQQFALTSGDVLTPDSARLVPTTAFESTNTARPKQLGSRIAFPANSNGYCQMALYKIGKDTVSSVAQPLTDHVPTYLPASPRAIEVSETAKLLAFVPPGLSSDLYVFKYEDDGDNLTQRAWQKFTFGGGILKAHWSGQLLYLTVFYPGSTATGGSSLSIEVLDFSPAAVDAGLSYGLRLDRRVFVSGATATGTLGQATFAVTMPDAADLVVYRFSAGGALQACSIVSKTLTTVSGLTRITFVVKSPNITDTFVVGRKFTMRYVFTEVFMRDGDGVPVIDGRLKLLKVLLRYVKTGFFKVLVTTRAQGSYEYHFTGVGVGLTGQTLGVDPLGDGDFAIPIQSQAQGTTVTVESDSHLPCCFPYAEWRGSLNMKSAR